MGTHEDVKHIYVVVSTLKQAKNQLAKSFAYPGWVYIPISPDSSTWGYTQSQP